jgi:hypothetical protein
MKEKTPPQMSKQAEWLRGHLNNEEKKSGFFDLPKSNRCTHPSHEPPMHIHIPQGKGYRHVCPSCGEEAVLIPQQITW